MNQKPMSEWTEDELMEEFEQCEDQSEDDGDVAAIQTMIEIQKEWDKRRRGKA